MKKTFLLFTAGALMLSTACTSTDTTTDETATTTESTVEEVAEDVRTEVNDLVTMDTMDDATFLSTAASSSMMEMELSNMALQRATDPKVKEFAQMIITDHQQASQDLKAAASQVNVTVNDAIMPMHQEKITELRDYTGDGFDEKYMDMMEAAHKDDISMFEAKSQNATETAVRDFAMKLLPSLRSHYEMATNIEDTVD